ncbi:MAG: hypothetical protein ABIF77_19295 [bacterium]
MQTRQDRLAALIHSRVDWEALWGEMGIGEIRRSPAIREETQELLPWRMDVPSAREARIDVPDAKMLEVRCSPANQLSKIEVPMSRVHESLSEYQKPSDSMTEQLARRMREFTGRAKNKKGKPQ